jgi:hypothetical protein
MSPRRGGAQQRKMYFYHGASRSSRTSFNSRPRGPQRRSQAAGDGTTVPCRVIMGSGCAGTRKASTLAGSRQFPHSELIEAGCARQNLLLPTMVAGRGSCFGAATSVFARLGHAEASANGARRVVAIHRVPEAAIVNRRQSLRTGFRRRQTFRSAPLAARESCRFWGFPETCPSKRGDWGAGKGFSSCKRLDNRLPL